MRLLPRDSDFYTVASALSLAVANYKPIPQLPTSSDQALDSHVGGDNKTTTSSNRGSSFQVQGSSFSIQNPDGQNSYSQTHSATDWGQPSLLYIPQDSNTTTTAAGAHKFESMQTVGPGSCPFSNGYTPAGGQQNLPPPVYPPFDSVKANIMRYRQQIGVNLATWFVQEGWMENGFMSCASGNKQAEFDLISGFGATPDGIKSARAYLEQHWDTFINEADFANMARMGINTVRVPIGYWSVGPFFCKNSPFEPYQDVYAYSWRYVARAINWAAKYDIGVILNLHGAYGSQNGQPHSGLDDGKIDFYNDYNMNLTSQLLVWLANEISDVTNVVGIELLNEPQNRDEYWDWLGKTMDMMRKVSAYAAKVPLYFHDAFVLSKGAQFVASRKDFIVQDHHSYYVYTPSDQSTSAQGHISQLSGEITDNFETQSNIARRNLIVGEWSCALNPKSLQTSQDKDAEQRKFCETQKQVWDTTTSGWTFWGYKMEDCDSNPGWCFQASVGRFLPSSFNSWGLNIKSLVAGNNDASTSERNALAEKIINTVNAIQLPVSPQSKLVSPNSNTTVKGQPRIGKVIPNDESGRIGMVLKSRQDRVVGSQAARASFWSRNHRIRDTTNTTTIPPPANPSSPPSSSSPLTNPPTTPPILPSQAAQRGFSDGFLTAKIFAGQAALSKLGFSSQYRQDSWSAHVASGSFQTSDQPDYDGNFHKGVEAAEAAISYVVSSFLDNEQYSNN